MATQFCPQVGDDVSAEKCNACNKDLVAQTHYCCKYINCLTTCDYVGKEQCSTYKDKLLEKLQ